MTYFGLHFVDASALMSMVWHEQDEAGETRTPFHLLAHGMATKVWTEHQRGEDAFRRHMMEHEINHFAGTDQEAQEYLSRRF